MSGKRSFFVCLIVAAHLVCGLPAVSLASGLTTLRGMNIVGYQGWFSCPGDNVKLGWRHWFRANKPDPHALVVDQWPDTSELSASELCPTGLTLRSGQPAYLFSSENPQTVDRHFAWMRQYGIDGVALQRFDSELRNPNPLAHTNLVMQNVRAAAEKNGRGFFIMYDLSGDDPDLVKRISNDWTTLTQSFRITDSPSYIRDRGRPIVGLWGLGINNRPLSPQQAATLIDFFHNSKTPATIIGGVPAYWRTLDHDSHSEPQWAAIYRSLDVISPWLVGRFHNEAEADSFVRNRVIPDLAETKKAGVEYMPVIFPGMSWFNGQNGKVPLDNIPRDCGKFYVNLANDMMKAGVTMLYTAMFDEVNEGTAIFKVVVDPRQTPVGSTMSTLSDNGCGVAKSDMYLRLTGQVTSALRCWVSKNSRSCLVPAAAR